MERRKLPRIDVDAPLQVCILGEDKTHSGRVANVSQGGLRFTSKASFSVGEVLRFDLADHILVGTVRYCVKDKKLFATGIELLNAINKPEFDALLQELKPEFVIEPSTVISGNANTRKLMNTTSASSERIKPIVSAPITSVILSPL